MRKLEFAFLGLRDLGGGRAGNLFSGGVGFDRRDTAHPIHALPVAIEQRVFAESFLNRCCPAYALWPGWFPLAQKGQEHFVAFANRLRRKQSEVSNPVPVVIRDLIRKAGDELVRGADGSDGPPELLIFCQKMDFLVVVAGEQPVFCQWRAA